jgi:hypothetical protein
MFFSGKDKQMAKKYWTVILLICVALLFVSCAAHQPVGQAGEPGFWLGLWHGIASPITFIISLFSDIRIYAFPNAGRWYDFGFLIGLCVWSGGGCGAAKRSRG